jgi:phosphatidylglycerol:prolipoprotein diacylglycerol transferase
MHPIFFKIGSLTIYTYGFLVFLGVLVGCIFCYRQAEKVGISKAVFSDIIFWVLLFSFIGARIFYVIVEHKAFFAEPFAILFGRSGFVFYGGIVFGVLSLYVLARIHKINFFKLADIFALGIPLAHAFGRIGCFSYGCCYGKPTTSFIGVLFPAQCPAGYLGVKVIPTQLIESFFLFVIFIIINALKKYKKFNGQLFLYYLIFYAILRFVIEFFRADSRGKIFFFSTSQFIAIIILILSIVCWNVIKAKNT